TPTSTTHTSVTSQRTTSLEKVLCLCTYLSPKVNDDLHRLLYAREFFLRYNSGDHKISRVVVRQAYKKMLDISRHEGKMGTIKLDSKANFRKKGVRWQKQVKHSRTL